MPTYGFDTASVITPTLADNAVAQFGTPRFFARYFTPSPSAGTTIDSTATNSNNEVRHMFNHGADRLVPISAPSQSRLTATGSTGSANGTADARTFMNAVVNFYFNVVPMAFSSSNSLYCYLDVEQSTNLSQAYWNAWATYVNGYQLTGSGAPFYASIYGAPTFGNICNIIANGASTCFGVWSSGPEFCSNCVPFGPSWNAYTCSGRSTMIWQYQEKGNCENINTCNPTHNFVANVDLDEGHTDIGFIDTTFQIRYAP